MAKTAETAVVTVTEPEAYNPALMDWNAATAGADQVLGHDLAKDELFDALIGVPFLITKVTFRKGVMREKRQFAYASCEAVIAPEAQLKRRRINLDEMPFDADSLIIFNDGSTGIYRQVVEYLSVKGFVTLPEGETVGEHGTSIFDCPPTEWTGINAGEISTPVDGWFDYEANVRLYCPRGIRVSEYVNDYNPSGSKTRYLG